MIPFTATGRSLFACLRTAVATVLIGTLLLLVAYAPYAQSGTAAELTPLDRDLLLSLPTESIDYESRIKPLLERRCVVCHGCYDAPCQLKLSSPEGIERGASKQKVYDGTRILAAEPTRIRAVGGTIRRPTHRSRFLGGRRLVS